MSIHFNQLHIHGKINRPVNHLFSLISYIEGYLSN